MKSLYPVQENHVARLLAVMLRHGTVLDSSATGCGKTVCAAEIARRVGKPVLVVCPKAVIPSWKRELEERSVKNYAVINYEKLRTGRTPFGKWGPRKVWQWAIQPGTLIIFDEVHKCSGLFTQNSKILIESRDFSTLMLSATVASSPVQLRAVGFLLGLHALHDFNKWCRTYGCELNPWNKLVFRGNQGHLDALAYELADRASRMTVADLKDHFAETQIITEPLDFGDDIAKIYDEMEAELAALAERAADDKKNAAAEALVAQLRARQKAELLKVPVIAEMLEDYIAEGKSIAVFCNFAQTIDALMQKVTATTVIIDGRQTAVERESAIQAFQQDKARIVLANVAAGGVGVSLHDITGKHPRVAIISPDWNEKSIIQAIGRVHRAGGKTPSQQRILFAANTIEVKVERAVREKIKHLETLNEKSACALQGTSYKSSPSPTPPTTPTTPTMSTKANHGERKHAEYSPSSLKNYEACASFQKREGTNAIAEQGTKIHEAIDSGDWSLLDDSERAIAEYCVEFRRHVQRQRTAKGAKLVATYQERVFDIRLGDEETFGSADLLDIYDDGTATLMDWKTGYGAVEDATTNAQVWSYCLGAMQAFPEIKAIEAYLVLPRRQEVSHAVFTREEADKLALRLGTIIARAKEAKAKGYQDEALFNPTEGTCDYCAAKGSCKALASKALIVARKSGFEVPDDVSYHGSAEDKAKLYKLAVLLEEWAADTKKELLRQSLEEGLEMPGYRLDHRRTPRTIDNPVAGYDAVKDIISLPEFLSAASRISVPALEKIVADKSDRGGKAKAKADLEDRLRDANALKEEGIVNILKPVRA